MILYLFYKKSTKLKNFQVIPPPPSTAPRILRREVAWIFFTPVSSDRPELDKYAATIFHDSYERCLHHQVTKIGNKKFYFLYIYRYEEYIHLFLELFLLLLLHSRKHNVIQQDLLDAQKVCFQNNLQKICFPFFSCF